MKHLSLAEYNELPKCHSCDNVFPTDDLDITGGYCINCAVAKGQIYCESKHLPQGIAIVCTRCGAQEPTITTYGDEVQVFCDNCSSLTPEEEE